MRRCLILTPSHSTQGGVERIIQSLHRQLPARGWSVVVGLARGARFHDPGRFRREYPELDCVEFGDGGGSRRGRVRGLAGAVRDVAPEAVLNCRLFDVYETLAELKSRGRDVRL